MTQPDHGSDCPDVFIVDTHTRGTLEGRRAAGYPGRRGGSEVGGSVREFEKEQEEGSCYQQGNGSKPMEEGVA